MSEPPPDPLPERPRPPVSGGMLERAYDAFSHDLRAFAWGLTRDASTADDVVQATFLKLAEVGHTADPATLRGWLFRVAANECFARRRKATRERRHLPRVADLDGGRTLESPAEAAARSDDVARIRRALQALSPEHRTLVESRIYAGKTFAAIAAESGVPLGTLLGRMQAALRRLAESLSRRRPPAADRTNRPAESS